MSMTPNQMAEVERETAAKNERLDEIAEARKWARREELSGQVRKHFALNGCYGTTQVDVVHFENQLRIASVMVINTGSARLQFAITPDEARNMAFALKQHADEVEEREQLLAELQQEAKS